MRWVAFSIVMAIAVLMLSCLPDTFQCEELQTSDLSSINYYIIEDSIYIFDSKDTRRTLQITDLSTGHAVQFGFNRTINLGDTTYLGGFAIYDPAFNQKARNTFTCSEYVLKYRTNDVDTLKVCVKLSYDEKCKVTNIDSASVSFNGNPIPQPPAGYGWDYGIYITR